MAVYHWKELNQVSKEYQVSERISTKYSLTLSPGQLGLPDDSIDFSEYFLPDKVSELVTNLIENYYKDSTYVKMYLDVGVIFQHVVSNGYTDLAGKEIDNVIQTLQRIVEIKEVISGDNNLKKVTINYGKEELVIDSWLFLATYLPEIKKTIKALSISKLLQEYEYDTYEENLQNHPKYLLYSYLEKDFVRKTGLNKGKYVFIDIFCHIFQIPVGQTDMYCSLELDRVLTDYKSGHRDTIKKLLKR